MLVTLLGIVTLASRELLENAPAPMLVTPSEIVSVVRKFPANP
jgi:hypothetical protein